ncbi:uncharacterized protein LOC133036996 [Cannabis sativa]|uniref:uncharacterized protein LOC133036996 n=1 Tax=Cannabis sativa TaxID=3483 RepID=UPI0029C9C94C|nr:uncharacterized protein LOC133036996 [Cannabis sativa]
MKFLGGWGSKPIVSHVVEGANPDTGELPTAVETFQKFHHKGNDWRNEFAQQAYEQMVEIAATQPAPTADEPEEPAVDPTQYPRDLPVMTQVLGERSRHLRGFGHLPRLKGVGAKRAPATHPSAQPTVTMEQYEALQKKVEEAEQTTQHTRQSGMRHNNSTSDDSKISLSIFLELCRVSTCLPWIFHHCPLPGAGSSGRRQCRDRHRSLPRLRETTMTTLPAYRTSNGKTEAFNKLIKHTIKGKLKERKDIWQEELPKVLWSYNTTPQSTIGKTPFLLSYGCKAIVPGEVEAGSLHRDAFNVKENELG